MAHEDLRKTAWTYTAVAANQTDNALSPAGGGSGAQGDYLEMLICTVATASAAAVSLKDGTGSAISIVPATAGVGVYPVPVKACSRTGKWSVTTGTGVTVLATGQFT